MSAGNGSRRVRVGDVEIYYDVFGEGEPVLFIHGLGSCGSDWAPQTEVFRQDYQVITADLRGHGQSSKPRKGYSMELFARDMAAVIAAMQTGPVHIVGISLGGMIAFQLAVTAPELIKSMTIVNSGPEVPAANFKQRIPLYIRLVLIHTLGLRKMAKMIGKRLFPEPGQTHLQDQFIERLTSNEKRCYVASLRAIFAGWGVADRLGDIRCPVLFITADQDYSPVELKQGYVDRLPNARMVVVPNSRHALPMEKPREFNQALAEFLASLAGRAKGDGSKKDAQ